METRPSGRYLVYLQQSFIAAFTVGVLVFVISFGMGGLGASQALLYAGVGFLVVFVLVPAYSWAIDVDTRARAVARPSGPGSSPASGAPVESNAVKQN